jgi:hypothetical protein
MRFAIPSLSGLTRMSSEGSARTALRSLFASARSMAARYHSYVGIRFQQDKEGRTHAVFLVPPQSLKPPQSTVAFPNDGSPNYDPDAMYVTLVSLNTDEPIILPRGVEFAAGDLLTAQANPDLLSLWHPQDPTARDARNQVPATTFTVVFSPAGQIVRKQVHVAQRRDDWDEQPPGSGNWVRTREDRVFNLGGLGLFSPDVIDRNPTVPPNITSSTDTDPDPQDLEPGPNFGGRKQPDTAVWQMSQGSIWVYEQEKRKEQTGLDAASCHPFTKYIQQSGSLIQLNAYTGAPVSTQQ